MPRKPVVTVIELRFAMREGFLHVTSEQVPGLHLCSDDFQAVIDDVIPAVKALFHYNRGVDVEVLPATDAGVFPATPRTGLDLPVGRNLDRLVAIAAAA